MDFNDLNIQDEETNALKQEHEHEHEEEEEEEEEEALSLSDFPIREPKHSSEPQSRRPSSDQFEVFNDLSSDTAMSHAEDIIFCGKLVPYNHKTTNPSLFDDHILRSYSTDDENSLSYSRRYCESLPELNPSTRSNSSSSTRLTRSSRSLDSKRLRRNSSLVMKSEVSDAHRNLWKRPWLSRGQSAKPRWYDWVFGLTLKFPPEMDLTDMKNRQVRRSKEAPAGDRRGRYWGVDLISVLSCKRHANVAVTHSIGCYEMNNTHVSIM